MKKIVIFSVMMLAFGSMIAQNSFRGVITYTAKSTGETAIQLSPETSTAEIKVFDDKVLTSSILFTNSPMVNSILLDGRKQFSCMDLSMLMMYLQQNDVELSYSGSSKILASNELTQSDIDSLTIPVTEGFYIEYVDGETKDILGYTAKKAVLHAFDDEEEDHPVTFWYNDEMGPEVNMLFNGIRGVALEYTLNVGEGRELTITATEIKKGKVKEVDMLLPSGYATLSDEEYKALWAEISEELRYLQEE